MICQSMNQKERNFVTFKAKSDTVHTNFMVISGRKLFYNFLDMLHGTMLYMIVIIVCTYVN